MRGRSRIVWSGLDEFGAQLRQSPTALVTEALDIAQAAAEGAKADMQYPRITGDLGDHITATAGTAGPFAVKATVLNPSFLATIFEYGTEARHYVTRNGKQHLLGRMPATPTFIPAVVRRRRAMYEELKALIASHGFTVSGDAE